MMFEETVFNFLIGEDEMSYLSSTLIILLGVLVVTGGCLRPPGDESGGGDVADVRKASLDDSAIEDGTPLTQIAVRSRCTNEGKSCLRFRDAKLLCSVNREDQNVPDFHGHAIFSVTRTLLTLFKSRIDVDEALLWHNHELTVEDITKLSPRLYLVCLNSLFGLPGERKGVAKRIIDENINLVSDRINLNKEVLSRGACYLPMWSIDRGEFASEIKVGRCDEVTEDKYKKRKNRIEITFHKLKS